MKRFVYAAAAIVLTGVLVLLVIAVAQRDARVSDSSPVENTLAYANKTAKPISGPFEDGGFAASSTDWPPLPIVRGNDSPMADEFPTPAAFLTGETENPQPNNIRKPNSTARLTEPPPLSAINSFLAPQQPGSSNPLAPNLMGRDRETINSAPKTLSSLPSAPSSISDYPGNQPLPGSTMPSGLPSTLTSVTSPPLYAAPPMSAPPSVTPDARPIATLGMPQPSPPSLRSSDMDSIRTTPSGPNSLLNSAPSLSSTATNQNAPIPSFDTNSYVPTRAMAPSSNDPQIGFNANSTGGSTSVGFSSAAPGMRQLDGSQNPSLEIHKRAPNEVQVGIPATFTVLVRNVGNSTAYDVQVVDSIPKGARLVSTTPQAQPSGPAGLTWKLGEMDAGSEKTITIVLVPESEGEIGSVASVNFAAQASVRTMSTQPKLIVKQQSETMVLGGDSIRIMIEVKNAGTGTASNVRLEEDVPQNMRHASGSTMLEREIGDLAPGESFNLDIDLTAVSAGKVSNVLRAIAQNAATNESTAQIEVVSPKLQIGIDGPKLRYIERQATYTASITNTGTAMATNVDLMLYLPNGLQFNSAENRGEYISNQHAVMWQLAELAAGQTATTKVTLLPVEEGDFVLRTQATADSIRSEAVEKPVRVEGQSELAFSIEDDNDPIETDGKTTYVVKMTNTGTRVDNDVQLTIELPDGAIVEQVDAPVNYQASQRAIQFSPIAQMKSKDQQTIRFVVRHSREGTHVVRAQLKSKLRPGAVIKEESTQVYRDQ